MDTEQPIQTGFRAIKFEATVRVSDRRVMQTGHTVYAPHHLDDEGNPTIECGLGLPDAATHGDHVTEIVSLATYEAIKVQEQLIRGDGGVILAPDHDTVSLLPPSQAWLDADQAREAAAAQREQDIALLAASGDPVHQALARLHSA